MVLNWKAAILVFAVALPGSLQAGEAGTVRVVDGDTIEVDGTVCAAGIHPLMALAS